MGSCVSSSDCLALFLLRSLSALLYHRVLCFSAAQGILSLNPLPPLLSEKEWCKHGPDFGEADENEVKKDAGDMLKSAFVSQCEKMSGVQISLRSPIVTLQMCH